MDLSALLDEISSTRSTWDQRGDALRAIERLMASLCGPTSSPNAFHAFIMLQDTFESNIASRLVAVLASWLPILQDSLHKLHDSKPLNVVTEPVALQPIMQALSIMQGTALLHRPSKAFLGRRWCIQLFLDFISASKYIPTYRDASDLAPPADEGLSFLTPNLANSVLDTLLCILVDTPKATRCFEEVGGLDVLVRTLKRPRVSREVRMKCLEFLYFYLLPEDSSVSRAIPPDIATNGSGHDIHDAAPMATPKSPATLASPVTSPELSPSSSFEEDGTFLPNPKVAELRMLRRDIDFVPATPVKKVKAAESGLGSPSKPQESLVPSDIPTKKRKHETESAMTPSSKDSSLGDAVAPVKPSTRRREHLRGRSDVTQVSFCESGHSSQHNVLNTPTKASRRSPVTPVQPKNQPEGKLKTPSRLHTRGSSVIDATLVGNPVVNSKKLQPLFVDMGLEPAKGGQLTADRNRVRSTAEKTALLGNYLGNVGALVEGMKKAGAWGLE